MLPGRAVISVLRSSFRSGVRDFLGFYKKKRLGPKTTHNTRPLLPCLFTLFKRKSGLHEEAYGLRSMSLVSVGLLGGLTCFPVFRLACRCTCRCERPGRRSLAADRRGLPRTTRCRQVVRRRGPGAHKMHPSIFVERWMCMTIFENGSCCGHRSRGR